MKKFNLEQAKKGAKVVTAEKKEAKILHFKRDNAKFPLVVIIENKDVFFYTNDGTFYFDKKSDKDLKMKS